MPARKARRVSGPSPPARPTLREVAARAGVSTATVSRVLNRSGSVRPALRQRVLAAVTALDYVPHAAARALASRRSRTVGAIIPTVDNAIFARCVQALQRRLSCAGHTLFLASSDYDPEHELSEAIGLVEHGVDALMLVGEAHHPRLYELLACKGVPYVVTWSYRPAMPHPCIGFDNQRAATRMTEHLLALGHRRVAMIAGVTAHNDRARARVAGVRAALAGHGLTLPRRLFREERYSIPAGRQAMRALLARRPRPTAVVCGNDVLALAALLECQAQRIAVPESVSITGFDDLELAAHVRPPLTTMRVPSREMGSAAAEYLLARLAGETPAETTELEVHLIARATTAPPP